MGGWSEEDSKKLVELKSQMEAMNIKPARRIWIFLGLAMSPFSDGTVYVH